MRCYEYLYVSVMPFINKILLNNKYLSLPIICSFYKHENGKFI